MVTKPLKPGWCQHCREECRDRLGADVYPDRPDLAEKVIWECVFCGARVGTHEDGPLKGQPLGTAANAELRKARVTLHGLLDPIWEKAHLDYPDAKRGPEAERIKAMAIIKRTARKRVYEFLAEKMGLPFEQTHVAMFSLEQCRDAWRALRGVAYADVRAWAKQRPAAPKAQPKRQARPSADPAQG